MARRDESSEISDAQVKMTWILLDRDGRRYMNEYPPYTHDTGHRQMQLFDTVRQEYPRIPSYLICDENGRRLYPLGRPTSNDRGLRMEVERRQPGGSRGGHPHARGQHSPELAAGLGLDPAAVKASVARWNAALHGGARRRLRPAARLHDARSPTPPFYGAPGLRPWCRIPRAGRCMTAASGSSTCSARRSRGSYAAGELGSAFGHLYMSGGNIAECFVSGRIAGTGAAALADWG